MKKHDLNLEQTMLKHFQRLSRLTLAVAILYVWLVSVGTCTIHAGKRHLVDRMMIFSLDQFLRLERKI